MGTNYYMRLKEPIMVPDHKEVHLCKISYGWKPLLEATNDADYMIQSFDDIRQYAKSGKYEFVDEYGEIIEWEDFEQMVKDHKGKSHKKESMFYIDDPATTIDSEGVEFYHTPFS